MVNIRTVRLQVSCEDYSNGKCISNDAFEVLCGIGCEVKVFRPKDCPKDTQYFIEITGNFDYIVEILNRHFGTDDNFIGNLVA